MKKIVFALLIAAFICSACGLNQNPLIGKWSVTKETSWVDTARKLNTDGPSKPVVEVFTENDFVDSDAMHVPVTYDVQKEVVVVYFTNGIQRVGVELKKIDNDTYVTSRDVPMGYTIKSTYRRVKK